MGSWNVRWDEAVKFAWDLLLALQFDSLHYVIICFIVLLNLVQNVRFPLGVLQGIEPQCIFATLTFPSVHALRFTSSYIAQKLWHLKLWKCYNVKWFLLNSNCSHVMGFKVILLSVSISCHTLLKHLAQHPLFLWAPCIQLRDFLLFPISLCISWLQELDT